MPRTTLMLEDDLLRLLKRRAADEGKTLQAVANELLRRSLTRRALPPFKLRLRGWRAKELPGVDLLDRDKLFEVMEGR